MIDPLTGLWDEFEKAAIGFAALRTAETHIDPADRPSLIPCQREALGALIDTAHALLDHIAHVTRQELAA